MVLPSIVTIGTNPLTSPELAFDKTTVTPNPWFDSDFICAKTDMFKSGVKPPIRRSGAEINGFLVLEPFFQGLEDMRSNYGGEKWNEMLFFTLYISK